ncbi:ABC transporter ATP-binding protein [Propionibacteriaceae bacterium Y2011]|uniref:ABC transporter ATP-binding protein n=1 Tax=Microlunatus sp. Y2014 TaxID=3418488 RepID=UPI003B4A9465
MTSPLPDQPTAQPSIGEPAVSTEPAMSVRGLTKQFDDAVVVDDLSLDIPVGSFYGMVGPNGAGKTTTLSMATGLLRPTAGQVLILGTDVWADPPAAKAKIGVLADGLSTFDRLSGEELLHYVGLIRGMSAEEVAPRATELLAALDLSESASKLVADYSAGMTKKILLASALIHAPRLLILDEPLEAVDPVSGQVIRQILRNYVAGGGTVIMSSHVMELVEGLCDHVAIIHQGRVRASGPVAEVRDGMSLVDRFIDLVGGAELAEGSLGWLRS